MDPTTQVKSLPPTQSFQLRIDEAIKNIMLIDGNIQRRTERITDMTNTGKTPRSIKTKMELTCSDLLIEHEMTNELTSYDEPPDEDSVYEAKTTPQLMDEFQQAKAKMEETCTRLVMKVAKREITALEFKREKLETDLNEFIYDACSQLSEMDDEEFKEACNNALTISNSLTSNKRKKSKRDDDDMEEETTQQQTKTVLNATARYAVKLYNDATKIFIKTLRNKRIETSLKIILSQKNREEKQKAKHTAIALEADLPEDIKIAHLVSKAVDAALEKKKQEDKQHHQPKHQPKNSKTTLPGSKGGRKKMPVHVKAAGGAREKTKAHKGKKKGKK